MNENTILLWVAIAIVGIITIIIVKLYFSDDESDDEESSSLSDEDILGDLMPNMENIVPSSDIIILPSHSESFGIVLIEALACGKGVIGSNTGGISEIITPDVGLLIDSKDYQSIANAIDKVFSDEDLKNKFSQNARQRAKVFSKMEIPYDE